MEHDILVGLISFLVGTALGVYLAGQFIAFGIKHNPNEFQKILDASKKAKR